MSRKLSGALLALGLIAAVSLSAQQAPAPAAASAQPAIVIDAEINAKIRKEGWDNSQILKTMHQLTDVYGPRLTGSPNHENAGKWAIKQMEAWGFVNGRLEPFDFGTFELNGEKRQRVGWLNEEATGQIIAPVRDNLVFEVLAWTPSTKGTVTASVVQIVTPQGPLPDPTAAAAGAPGGGGGRGGIAIRPGPTEEELAAYFKQMAPRVKGAIVYVGEPVRVPFQETDPAKRRVDAEAKAQYQPDPNAPAAAGRGGRAGGPPAGRGGGAGAGAPAAAPTGPVRLTNQQVATRVNEWLLASGAALRLNDAGMRMGMIRAFSFNGYDATKTVPTVVMRNEDFGRIARLVADGLDVKLRFNIVNRTYPAGKTSYNTIAEIPGTDKADEVVMLGGHLDSWHSATGATDNAIGCAVMMEAARILKAIGVKPRRTIRVALWGGEEQGLLGSKAYVEQHFGTAENPKPEFAKFNGYFNVDSGTGRIRGASIFGPPEAGNILREYFRQFEDFGVYGATTTASRATGGTDSTSFNAAGLPGIGLGQDPIEYNSFTWHTNLDTIERIVEDDVKKSAIAIASAVYHVAMRDQMLPRFTKETMPPVPGAGRAGGAGQR
jgi:carboxypeptidase Q